MRLTRTPVQYRDPDMIQKVKSATGDNIHIALDTISGEETQFTAIKALAEGVPGRLLVILPPAEGISGVRKDVEVKCSSPSHSPEPPPSPRQQLVNSFHSHGYIYRVWIRVQAIRSERRRQTRTLRILAASPRFGQGWKAQTDPDQEFRWWSGESFW